jgi:hypothetical protein
VRCLSTPLFDLGLKAENPKNKRIKIDNYTDLFISNRFVIWSKDKKMVCMTLWRSGEVPFLMKYGTF